MLQLWHVPGKTYFGHEPIDLLFSFLRLYLVFFYNFITLCGRMLWLYAYPYSSLKKLHGLCWFVVTFTIYFQFFSQNCFWSGRVAKNHKLRHQTQEYCLPVSFAIKIINWRLTLLTVPCKCCMILREKNVELYWCYALGYPKRRHKRFYQSDKK